MSSRRHDPGLAALLLAFLATASYGRLAFSQDAVRKQSSPVGETMTLSNDRITIVVSNRSLVTVLDELSTMQTEVTILAIDRVAIDRRVTVSLQSTPFEMALRALFDQEDLLMLYGGEGQRRSALTAVFIYPKGGANRLVAAARQNAELAVQMEHALDSPDERERGRAIQSVIDRAGTQAEDVVLRALDDQSDYVRTVALSSALEAAFALPVDVLVRLATADPLASVRMHAMRALASNVEGADGTQRLNAIQEVASRDPDPTVRDKAAHLLQQLTNPASPEEGPPQ